tara:strand:+ start:1923 stop:2255 length:333 start_codon:yes stop_codon:yes gene_type:complete
MSNHYIAILEPYADDEEYEDFIYDLGYFEKYLGKEVFVKGENLNWRGSCGEITFILEDIKQIFEKLVHQDTDFSFLIRGTEGKSNYIARSSNHDCNSSFVLSFSNPKEVA